MVQKIDIKKIINNNVIFLNINLKEGIVCYKNDVQILTKKINFDISNFCDNLINYIKYWDNQYLSDNVISGILVEIKIYTLDEIINYTFKNKFPDNYNEFYEFVKKVVNINE